MLKKFIQVNIWLAKATALFLLLRWTVKTWLGIWGISIGDIAAKLPILQTIPQDLVISVLAGIAVLFAILKFYNPKS